MQIAEHIFHDPILESARVAAMSQWRTAVMFVTFIVIHYKAYGLVERWWNKVKRTNTADSRNFSLSSMKLGGRQIPYVYLFYYLIVFLQSPL